MSEVCAFHEERNKTIDVIGDKISTEIIPVINQHSAYWKFFFWGSAVALTIIGLFVANINKGIDEIREASIRIERSADVSNVTQEYVYSKVEKLESIVVELDKRIDKIDRL